MRKNAFLKAPLDRRLTAAADFVRPGAVFADIGTDHAYLPVFLAEKGVIKRAIAADINRGPIERAAANIAASGYSDIIKTCQTDGLVGLECEGVTDIAICGMGGELIARIIESAEFTRDRSVRLILQPMTKAESLRDFLINNGFAVIGEKLAKEDKVYQIICAEFTGENSTYTDAELYLGRFNIESKDPLLSELAEGVLAFFEKKRQGKATAGMDTDYEDRMISLLKEIINEIRPSDE